jgi:hypothetical protein
MDQEFSKDHNDAIEYQRVLMEWVIIMEYDLWLNLSVL